MPSSLLQCCSAELFTQGRVIILQGQMRPARRRASRFCGLALERGPSTALVRSGWKVFVETPLGRRTLMGAILGLQMQNVRTVCPK